MKKLYYQAHMPEAGSKIHNTQYIKGLIWKEVEVNAVGKKTPYKKFLQHIDNDTRNINKIPKRLYLKTDFDPGFFFGGKDQVKEGYYVGMPQG